MRIAFPMRCALTLCALLVSLSGCTLLPHSEPVTLYQLPSPKMEKKTQSQMITLCISTPRANRLIAGDHIVVIQKNTVTTYPNAKWTDKSPRLWRDYIVEALQQDNRVKHLCTDDEPILADYALNSTLRSFYYVHENNHNQVIITVDLRLVFLKHQKIIASRQFTVHEPLASHKIDELVQAFGRASNRLASFVTDWTLMELSTK